MALIISGGIGELKQILPDVLDSSFQPCRFMRLMYFFSFCISVSYARLWPATILDMPAVRA
jgi:hypothetical protein